MSAYNERVEMTLHAGEFILSARQAANAASTLRQILDMQHPTTLDAATWEPHDWSEFE